MKSYTDIDQSKKLAEILPLESADMRYGYIAPYEYSDRMYDGGYDEIPYPKDFLIKNPNFSANEYDAELPCWSLATLLSVLPPYLYEWEKGIDFNLYPSVTKKRWWCAGYISQDLSPKNKDKFTLITHADNPVDACYEMIIKLHEQNLL